MADNSNRAPEQPSEIRFHFIKSEQFRTIHVDGVHGGPTPNGLIQMAVFSERFPIPQETVYEVGADGKLGAEKREMRVARPGIVRNVEASLIMDLRVAQGVHKWLGRHIDSLERSPVPGADEGGSE